MKFSEAYNPIQTVMSLQAATHFAAAFGFGTPDFLNLLVAVFSASVWIACSWMHYQVLFRRGKHNKWEHDFYLREFGLGERGRDEFNPLNTTSLENAVLQIFSFRQKYLT